MQGWHYDKGLIYYRTIFRLTKLAFLRARLILLAEILAYNKSALCRSASPEFSFVLFYT